MSDITPEGTASEAKPIIPLSEISKHNNVDDLWMAVNGKVYDITKFVDQHPGGEEVLVEYAGSDATGPFEDVGHSENAIEMLSDYYVGEGNPEELKVTKRKTETDLSEDGGSNKFVILGCILVVALAYYYFKALRD